MSRPPGLLSEYAARYKISTRSVQRLGVYRLRSMTELGREIITRIGRIHVTEQQMKKALERLRSERKEWRTSRRKAA